ncbi:hypothetical protein L3X38_008877 [Prunus dulcis]|uniref:Uncharacterized protein n=1 Tax=Prunus dulcis TaxID=3755 RepID=A0AAD5F7B4_PRUDU|nr:hypothetical protein L3X38_008877 [Prunus dulcis]
MNWRFLRARERQSFPSYTIALSLFSSTAFSVKLQHGNPGGKILSSGGSDGGGCFPSQSSLDRRIVDYNHGHDPPRPPRRRLDPPRPPRLRLDPPRPPRSAQAA